MGQWSLMLRSNTLTSVNASGLFVYIYIYIYIYIWSISTTDVGVILVGDSISWIRPSCVIVESQEEYGFSKSVLKSPNKRMSAIGFTALRLSIICTKYRRERERERERECTKYRRERERESGGEGGRRKRIEGGPYS